MTIDEHKIYFINLGFLRALELKKQQQTRTKTTTKKLLLRV